MGLRTLLCVTVLMCTITGCLSIIGGRDARRGAWPWMVHLEMHNRAGGVRKYGGSLISDQWVMTTGYLIPSKVVLELSFARVGELSLKEPSGMVVKLKRVVQHPDYQYQDQTDMLYNNIALVQLQAAVPFSDTVAPVVLPSPREVFSANAECWVTGWGWVTVDRPFGEQTLKEVQVPLVDESKCLQLYPNKTTSHLCAGDLEGGKDACSLCESVCVWGDAGGPLVCRPAGEVERRFLQVGIVSFAKCGYNGEVSLYTRVYDHLQFIQDTIMESECHNFPQFEACF